MHNLTDSHRSHQTLTEQAETRRTIESPGDRIRINVGCSTYKTGRTTHLPHFKRDFPELFKANGYQGFMGRPLNEAGLNLAKNGNGREAIEIVSTLSYFYPEAPQAYDSLAYVHYLLGDKNAARKEFEKARELSAGFNSDYHSTNYDD